MSILCTHPGKYGDLIWALPSCRAIAEATGEPVDLQIPAQFGSITGLLKLQPYIHHVYVDHDWITQDTAPRTPVQPPAIFDVYETVLDLGYREWPTLPLPYEVERKVNTGWALARIHIDPNKPWITPPNWAEKLAPRSVAFGWTDEHFELKVGLTRLIFYSKRTAFGTHVNLSNSSRWNQEYFEQDAEWPIGTDWVSAAAWLRQSAVFLGDCSALHVLACGLGVPCVIMEPAEARHHPIFWPYGTTGPQVTQVLGTDGKWTWDARHVAETLEAVRRRRVPEGVPQ